MADGVQRLPLELWVEILGHASIPDVLRFKQVNRTLYDAILTSPLIQHKIDLFAAGFEYNPGVGMGLSDSRKALLQYRSNLDTLCPIEEMKIHDFEPDTNDGNDEHLKMVGGVYAIIIRDSVWLFTPGSASRGMPQKEWEIPLPLASVVDYSFYPVADVIAFVEQSELWIRIHLRTLSNGGDHPAAQFPTILYPRQHGNSRDILFVSVTNSRLVVVACAKLGQYSLVVWDWKNARVLLELDGQPYDTAEFIDDYRLLICLVSRPNVSPSIVVIDTEKVAEGVPVQTTFRLSPQFGDYQYPRLVLERGAHEPSPAESLAPFYHDPTQRIAALVMPISFVYPFCVFRVQALLELSQGREGSEIKWDEWEKFVAIPSVNSDSPGFDTAFWASGCRLFCFYPTDFGSSTGVKLFDLSVEGRAKYLGERVSESLGGVRYLSPTGADGQIPWDIEVLSDAYCGHDSIVISRTVRVFGSSLRTRRLQIWTF